ncbi:hypothetical protein BGLA2_610077 [Burkholderia gladioli]|nr:hypothetical protein BGLA2_610077 [Burkholderia gladioli]
MRQPFYLADNTLPIKKHSNG